MHVRHHTKHLIVAAGVAALATTAFFVHTSASDGPRADRSSPAAAAPASRVLQAGGILIDDMEAPQAPGKADLANPVQDRQRGASILGGERLIRVEPKAERNKGAGYILAAVADGSLQLGHKLGAAGPTLLVYDGVGGSGLGDVDLTQGGSQTAVRLLVSFCDGPFDVVLRVHSDATRFSEVVLPAAICAAGRRPAPGDSAEVLLPFSGLQRADGAAEPADLHRVNRIQVELRGMTRGADLIIDRIDTVPGAPGSAGVKR
jgi:hypothetical protein